MREHIKDFIMTFIVVLIGLALGKLACKGLAVIGVPIASGDVVAVSLGTSYGSIPVAASAIISRPVDAEFLSKTGGVPLSTIQAYRDAGGPDFTGIYGKG